jgi:hypothetical protein
MIKMRLRVENGEFDEKHPPLREPAGLGAHMFEEYAATPAMLHVNITAYMIAKVAPRLFGGAGPSGVDAVTLQDWLMRYGKESGASREGMVAWAARLPTTILPGPNTGLSWPGESSPWTNSSACAPLAVARASVASSQRRCY